MSATSKVSFTIRRPTPVSRATSSGADSDTPSSFKIPSLPRHLANPNDSIPGSPLARSNTSSPKLSNSSAYYGDDHDSSDENDEELEDELVTEFDRFGAQRRKKAANQAPLVIPAQQNRDWRELARKRRSAAQYVPPSAKATTGQDGSVGGLGIKDTINSGPVLSGLQVKESKTAKKEDIETTPLVTEDIKMEDDETEDQRALRAILAETNGIKHEGPIVDIIPTPISEADAYKQDIDELPDVATLDDYARVPVSQFGAALLRGMGWKEGTAATRKAGKGLAEPYLPVSRPALLGIGAKEREVLDDGSGKKVTGRPEKRYVPVIKQERPGDGRPSSAPAGRNRRDRSRSPGQRKDSSVATSRQSSPGRRRDDDDRRWGGDRRKEHHNRNYEREERYRDSSRGDRDRERRTERSQEASRRRRD